MRFILAALLCAFPVAAVAQNACLLTKVCFNDQGCEAIKFPLSFGIGPDGPSDIRLQVPGEEVLVSVAGNSDIAFMAGANVGGFHVLSVRRDTGAARYSKHFADGSGVASYLGSCQVGG